MISDTIPIPDKIIEMVNNSGDFCIRRKWLSSEIIPAVVFTVIWDLALIYWYTIALINIDQTHWQAFAFPIVHIAFGIGLTYYCIGKLFNQTDIVIDNSELCVKTSPIKWSGDQRVLLRDITDIQINEKINNQFKFYNLDYIDKNNTKRRLVSTILDFEQAEYLAFRIKSKLEILS